MSEMGRIFDQPRRLYRKNKFDSNQAELKLILIMTKLAPKLAPKPFDFILQCMAVFSSFKYHPFTFLHSIQIALKICIESTIFRFWISCEMFTFSAQNGENM